MALLEIDHLSRRVPERPLPDGLELTVAAGEILALAGTNRTGKSPLAYLLMGCKDYRAEKGEIRFDGQCSDGLPLRARLDLLDSGAAMAEAFAGAATAMAAAICDPASVCAGDTVRIECAAPDKEMRAGGCCETPARSRGKGRIILQTGGAPRAGRAVPGAARRRCVGASWI